MSEFILWLAGRGEQVVLDLQTHDLGAMSRDLAARLARVLTLVALGERRAAFVLTHPERVHNLTRRPDHAGHDPRPLRQQSEANRQRLPKTENRPRPRG